MNNWFECKVKYEKIDEQSGKTKKKTEPYLVDSISFTEAETRITEQMESMISGEFNITNIKRVNYSDVFNYEEGDRWFKCKVVYVDVDEASGKEKKTSNYMLVLADNVDHAYERLHESLADMIIPFEVPSIAESPIMDIFPYFDGDSDIKNEEIPENLRPVSDEEYARLNAEDEEENIENTEIPKEENNSAEELVNKPEINNEANSDGTENYESDENSTQVMNEPMNENQEDKE